MSAGYKANTDLPPEVRSALPSEAQDVYRVAYNSAVAAHAERPAEAAMAAVKIGWEEREGVWVECERD